MIQVSSKDARSLLFNKWVRLLFLMAFLFLPDDFFKVTSIYHSETLPFIAYKWLDYDFSFLFILIFAVAFLYIPKDKMARWFLLFSVLIFIRSVFFNIFNKESVFQYGSYELHLSFLCGWTLFFVAKRWTDRYINIDRFKIFELFCWIHLTSQILGMLLSRSGYSGRYYAINLDLENTCYLYAIYVLILQEREESLNWKAVIFILGMLLTGSRIPLVLLFLVVVIQKIKVTVRNMQNNTVKIGNVVEIFATLLAGGLLIAGISSNTLTNIPGIDRIISFLNTDQNISDIGRIQSLNAGIRVLKDNYWGIDYSFLLLQKEMAIQGFPTFPHSQFLIWRIIMGPLLFWGAFAVLIKTAIQHIKAGSGYAAVFIYIILFFILTGSPLSNFKSIFIDIWTIYLSLTVAQRPVGNKMLAAE